MQTELDAKLLQIFRDLFRFPGESLEPNLSMQDVDGWDSMQHLILIGELEAAFGVRLSTNEILAMTSVAEIKRVLTART
ncbi:MAG: acyl carrier protein [Kiritimatiellae bacterium]|nr:acyl carrier protein [Kiritimatiellia bacterium]